MNFQNVYSFIWCFVKRQPWGFALLFFTSLAMAVDILFWPYFLRCFVDILSQTSETRSVVLSLLFPLLGQGIFFLVLVEAGFRYRGFLQSRVFPTMEAQIRMTMFEHVQKHSPAYFTEHFTGTLANKISDMTTHVTSSFFYLLIFFPTVVTATFALIILWKIHSFFALILLIWVLLCIGICAVFLPKCVHYAHVHGDVRSTLAGKMLDSLTNYLSVNLFFRFKWEKKQLFPLQQEEQQANNKARRYIAWLFFFMSGGFLLGMVGMNALMIHFWMKNEISTGVAVQIFNTLWGMVSAVWWCCEGMPEFFTSLGLARQAFSVMEDKQDVEESEGQPDLIINQGDIVFDKVHFCYGDRKLFTEKSVTIRGGEKVGLVGHSGAGKSSFVNLLLRLYKPEQGRIFIDTQDLASVSLASLREQVVLIPQDPQLFHRSFYDNIQYSRLDAREEEVREAARLAHCEEFILRSPQGYKTLVGDRGMKLSGGEKQRIAIARAFLAKAPILILDEATSMLDSITEGYIQESLEKLMRGKTTLVIAHRLSTLLRMDRILVFNMGQIIEEGTHTDLLAKQGAYAALWQAQAGGFLK